MVMFVQILLFCHLILYFSSLAMRTIIYLYLKKKPPGLQTVLDLLMMNILRVQMFSYSFFMILLASGFFHGQLPYIVSQVMIFIAINTTVYMFGLFQFFLLAKAVMIFKQSIMDEISDSWIIGLSRTSAAVYAFIRYFGDYMTQEARPGVLTRFLTGTDDNL